MGEARERMLKGLPPRGMNHGEPIQVNIDLKDATPKVCECGCSLFTPAVQLYTVSALLSPIGKELTAQQPVLVCMECRKPIELKAEER
jgi:hypothetical protein